MNRRVLIAMMVLLFYAINARAQWTVDSLKKQSWQQFSDKYGKPKFVLDQEMLGSQLPQAKLSALNPKDIANIDIIKSSANRNVYGNEDYTIVYVVTKKFAKKLYQNRLAAFSPDYKSYLESHSNNDDEVQYVLNSQPLESKSEELLDRLYKLSPDNITNVAFADVKGKKTLIIEIKFDE